jgi:hypothetical protein
MGVEVKHNVIVYRRQYKKLRNLISGRWMTLELVTQAVAIILLAQSNPHKRVFTQSHVTH